MFSNLGCCRFIGLCALCFSNEACQSGVVFLSRSGCSCAVGLLVEEGTASSES